MLDVQRKVHTCAFKKQRIPVWAYPAFRHKRKYCCCFIREAFVRSKMCLRVLHHQVKQNNSTKERLKNNQSKGKENILNSFWMMECQHLYVLQHRECKRTAPRRGWITINTKGKKTSLNNFGCQNISTCCYTGRESARRKCVVGSNVSQELRFKKM